MSTPNPMPVVALTAADGDETDGTWRVLAVDSALTTRLAVVWLRAPDGQGHRDLGVYALLTPAGLAVDAQELNANYDRQVLPIARALATALDTPDRAAISAQLMRVTHDHLAQVAAGNPLAHGGAIHAEVKRAALLAATFELPQPEQRAAALALLAGGNVTNVDMLHTTVAGALATTPEAPRALTE